ncbi:MAG: gluconate 2-dehydrogenase subunit 3 family protein [Chromatiales bacterium]|nr:gluconate 2-dehydrogenase subunit 3 family protein [Gammaproteobacteria bacterium]MCP5352867.1 gluconate 2-dehydrogenase subunit 3 family protein [Chromatiales bacterium]
MTRKPRIQPSRPFEAQRTALMTRRRFLLGLVGGSVAALFPLRGAPEIAAGIAPDAGTAATVDTWAVLDATLNHLLPSEPDSPGASDIHALDYLRFVINDTTQDETERDFLRQGTVWLEDLSREREGKAFIDLDHDARERLLRQVAASGAGENWLSTVLLHLMEALLTDPVYGGNFEQRGWQWLWHTPGFPRPPAGKTYPELLKS